MELLKALAVIFGFSYAGDFVSEFFNLPIPGSIIGLVSLFIALKIKLVDYDKVSGVANSLQKNMAFYFVPLVVGLTLQKDLLKEQWLNLLIVILVTTTITYITVGVISEKVSKK